MGVLDDAIREHLELKRQHGASDADVRKAEQEALGPVRIDAIAPAAEPVEAEPEPVHEAPPGFQPFDADAPTEHILLEPEASEPVAPDPVASDPEPELSAPTLVHEPDFEPIETVEEAVPLDDAPRDEPLADAPAIEEPIETFDDFEDDEDDELTEGDAPLAEPPADSPPPAEDEEEAEDLLEDTPGFLQETPEHDRLWFEQKPPRDFDFND